MQRGCVALIVMAFCLISIGAFNVFGQAIVTTSISSGDPGLPSSAFSIDVAVSNNTQNPVQGYALRVSYNSNDVTFLGAADVSLGAAPIWGPEEGTPPNVFRDVTTLGNFGNTLYNLTVLRLNFQTTASPAFPLVITVADDPDAGGGTLYDTPGFTLIPHVFDNSATDPVPPPAVWVDDDYTSATSGWGLTRFDTISNGLAAVTAGGDVFVYAGAYSGQVAVNKSVNIEALEYDEVTTLTAASSGLVVTAQPVTIRGLAITGAAGVGNAAVVVDGVTNVVVTECTLVRNATGVIFKNDAGTTLSASIVANNSAGVDNQNPALGIVAENVYWGSASGPSGQGAGSGDSVSTGVAYIPWAYFWGRRTPVGTGAATVALDAGVNDRYTKHCVTIPGTDIPTVLKLVAAADRHGADNAADIELAGGATITTSTAVITIEYDPSTDLGAFVEEQMRLARWNGATYQFLTSTVDTAQKTVSGVGSGFSTYAAVPNPAIIPPPTPTPTPTPTPSPTPTLSPTPTESPTPSPTPSPSPTPGPSPTPSFILVRDYTFDANTENWHQAGAGFTLPIFYYTGGQLSMVSQNSYFTFGYWASPDDEVPIYADSLYYLRWEVSTDVTDRSVVPEIRLRTNTWTLQQAVELDVKSVGSGDYSPTPLGNVYQMFLEPANNGYYLALSFDLLNFDPTDAADGTVNLDRVTVYRMSKYDITSATPLKIYNFNSSTYEGWTFYSPPAFTAPISGHSGSGLMLLANNNNFNTFGYFTSDGADITLTTPTLYRATFTVTTDQTDQRTVPGLRLRLNAGNFQSSVAQTVSSTDDGAYSPTPMGKTYTVYYLPPTSALGEPLLASFDMFHFSADDNPTGSLILESAIVETLDVPSVP